MKRRQNQEEMSERVMTTPPSQEVVAQRTLSLHALVIRAEFEYAYHLPPDREAPELVKLPPQIDALYLWMEEQGVQAYLSPQERILFALSLGAWSEQDLLDNCWRKEALGVLLWALSCISTMARYDQEFPDQIHLEQIGWLRPTGEFFERCALLPQETLTHAREVAALWHWRAKITRFSREQGRLARRYNLTRIIREAVEKAHANRDIPFPIRGDFPAFNKPYARLNAQEQSLVVSIVRERHFALNWLCGYSQEWDNTPTDM